MHLHFQLNDVDGDVTAPPLEAPLQRRNLLEYHGDRLHLHVQWSDPASWLKDIESAISMGSTECQHLIQQHEPFLNTLGYSLQPEKLRNVTKPQIEHGTLLWDI